MVGNTQSVKQNIRLLQLPYQAGGRHGNHKDQHPKDWIKRLLEESTMHVVEICGVVGRLIYMWNHNHVNQCKVENLLKVCQVLVLG